MSFLENIRCIVTDIEGTTTSVSFVYEVLFPYFRAHALDWESDQSDAFSSVLKETSDLVLLEENQRITDKKGLIQKLIEWSLLDRKISVLKSFQGMVWEQGYQRGEILGHVYADVKPSLIRWKDQGICLAVFSSGSVPAQKLLFGHSQEGDLNALFTANFDTHTGMKKDHGTYAIIAEKLNFDPREILFLSDVVAELQAASLAGMQTLQLVRPGTVADWKHCVNNFQEIT